MDSELQLEEDKLDKKRKRDLKEYEQQLNDQFDLEAKRKMQKLQLQRDNEERELEHMKLKIDQMFQDQVESYKKQCQSKYEKERRLFEDEKRKRFNDIQHSIDKLNIASSDKDKLREEVETLNREQRELQMKIDNLESEFDSEKDKKR